MQKLQLRLLTDDKIDIIAQLTQQLHPAIALETIRERLQQMFKIENYRCFGFYDENTMVGLCSGWITVRLYSGKQLEIDNVIIDAPYQSKGYGKGFIKLLEVWAKEKNCESVELNAYLRNVRGHKFYHNEGYGILGFHYQKLIQE